jgi:hypothetical protein
MHHSGLASLRRMPELAWMLEHADHVDVKTVIGSVDLRTFLANMFCYQPSWITALYGVRAVFVRFLGMHQHGIPRRLSRRDLTPETLPMQEGQSIAFFTVRMAREEHYWIAEAKATHLSALLGVVMEPFPNQSKKRFSVITVVSYHNWTGPIYFHTIRPFHHLVIGRMAIAGVGTSHHQLTRK